MCPSVPPRLRDELVPQLKGGEEAPSSPSAAPGAAAAASAPSYDRGEGLPLLLLLLVPAGDVSGQLVQLPAVGGLYLCPPPEDVLELRDQGELRLKAPVEALELVVQLDADVCKGTIRKSKLFLASIAILNFQYRKIRFKKMRIPKKGKKKPWANAGKGDVRQIFELEEVWADDARVIFHSIPLLPSSFPCRPRDRERMSRGNISKFR